MDSALSYRAFYIMIDRLKEARLIDVATDDSDRRVRLLVLGKEFDRTIVKLPAHLEKAEAEELQLEKAMADEVR